MSGLRSVKLCPVAAALRARGDWTLDGAARDFDASDWWYRLQFDSPARDADERIVLGFDGLATIATVWLNGNQLSARATTCSWRTSATSPMHCGLGPMSC